MAYYWLRLKRDFFKRHDIRIIEEMPNGKDYILFYLKLLCESVDHEGCLRFSDEIPYDEQMLATITNTNIDIVRVAIKAFSDLGMMDILDDGTLYMNGVEKMIGRAEQDEYTRESSRLRSKAYRERKRRLALEEKRDGNVTVTPQSHDDDVIRHGDIELDIELDIDKDKKNKEKNKKENIKEIFFRIKDDYEFSDKMISSLDEWFTYKTERKDSYTEIGMKKLLTQVKNKINEHGEEYVIAVIDNSMSHTWQGITWDSVDPTKVPTTPKYKTTPMDNWDSYMWSAAIKDGYKTQDDYKEWRSQHVII